MIAQRSPTPRRFQWFALLFLALSSALIGMFGALLVVPLPFLPDSILAGAPTQPTPAQADPAKALADPVRAAPCQVINNGTSISMIRSAPSDEYSLVGLLAPGAALDSIGRTANGWYVVNYGERLAWISSAAAAPRTDTAALCAALPIFHNPLIADAPADLAVQVLSVDRDGDGALNERISTPNGDGYDLVWIEVINLHTAPPHNYREMILLLTCEGEGAAFVRWGSYYHPTLACGASITLPFMVNASRQPFVVRFAEAAPQSYIEYRLEVVQAVG
ncbi:MAG: SH3 domain-containing protein [bacterium]|nr:SH3 domain-containing protein [bacterium]